MLKESEASIPTNKKTEVKPRWEGFRRFVETLKVSIKDQISLFTQISLVWRIGPGKISQKIEGRLRRLNGYSSNPFLWI